MKGMYTRGFLGSSPRVRRKRHERHVHARVPRLIPACAGKTVWVCAAVFGIPAYPRVCGENHSNSNDVVFSFGSSPRVRGKRVMCGSIFGPNGLIPACAGKTSRLSFIRTRHQAHPRVCGENIRARDARAIGWGSSPRVRGKQTTSLSVRSKTGLIPACAGKTLPPRRRTHPQRAHPRVCGENRGKARNYGALAGSSPRVRGKLPAGCEAGIVVRLIPACAGKT